MSSQLPSKNPTGYLGIAQTNPPQLYLKNDTPPATLHARNFNIGDLWVDLSANMIWMLTQMVNTAGPSGIINATWTSIAAAAGVAITQLLPSVGGGILPIGGICKIYGDGIAGSGVVTTHTAPGDTITISVLNASTLTKGVSSYNPLYFSTAAGVVSLVGPASLTWNAALALQPLTQNTAYYTTLPGLTTFTLPAVANLGSIIKIQGASIGGWTIDQGAGQQIFFSSTVNTTLTTGSCSSIDSRAGLELLCIVANTTWQVTEIKGNISVI